ncbi:ABC transporter ATP-binding protein [Actinospica durhamensis]|uniref:ABC transporter ATP-binding protein n=1 Tax=Actinospica durhamensis TaxID=1508375 RepID=A0A941EML6_9ACTN|nr:ABC transporter ATP-binding protein [Actinospica durhamensis]MBR7831789.1 ABC transporter ATP-binding protein [Actinospica durhamensis]
MAKWREQALLASRWQAVPVWARWVCAAMLVLRSAMTAGTALVTGALVGQVVQAAMKRPADVTGAVTVYVTVLVLGQVLNLADEPLRYLVVRAVDGAHRRAVSRWAGAPDGVAHLEDAARQDDLLLAASDPDNWTEGTVGQATWAQSVLLTRWVGGLSGLAVIGRDDPLVCVLLLAGLLVFRKGQRGGFLGVLRVWAAQMVHRRRADYWTSLLTTPQPAKEVRIFGLGGWVGERHAEEAEAHLGPSRRAKMADMRRQVIWWAIGTAVLTAVGYAVGLRALDGRMPIGRLSADLTAVVLLFPLFAVSDMMVAVEGGLPRLLALDRLRRAVPASAKPWGAAGPGLVRAAPPVVRFEGVSFAYPGSTRQVLDGIDLEIRPGEVLAVVGLNGAGKSTLIKVLSAMYPPDGGRVTIDGTDLYELGVDGWRAQLSVVFQDFIRYELSAHDNIAAGNARHASPQDVALAAQQAGVHELIKALPAGWETPLSAGVRDGVDLSGGQWQRIALARALLAVRTGARVLVLDEPTAHLDVHTEFEVFHQLIEAARGVSVVLISHRLSTVREADRIVLIEGGKVLEAGSHQELIAADGEYARLFRLQAEQFEDTAGEAGNRGEDVFDEAGARR